MSKIMALTPSHVCDPQIAVAATRAGAWGILDLTPSAYSSIQKTMVERLARFAGKGGNWGIRWDSMGLASRNSQLFTKRLPNKVPMLVLAGLSEEEMPWALAQGREHAHRLFAEVVDPRCARKAQELGFDGLILKGNESGGRVSPQTSFLLLQELHKILSIPYWVQGGINHHTAPATMVAGASGIVLCEQLWLMDEAPFTQDEREVLSRLDGSETTLIGRDPELYRLFKRPGEKTLEPLIQATHQKKDWKQLLIDRLCDSQSDPLILMGQDIAFASSMAKQFGTVGRTITAFKKNLADQIKKAKKQPALTPGSPLAQIHRTQFPIVQGPMTRVSDVAQFAHAVEKGGALPLLALAVLREAAVRSLLHQTKELLDGRSWGVGILGFVPLALRKEQLSVIKEVRPPFALIAGGRPSQSRELEADGISTYLHVPSPGLLKAFVKEGARKFVLEGNECGGHTGPRSSFILWGIAVETLLQAGIEDYDNVQVLFAGGIHDALSAAVTSVIAAPLIARGVKVGVLMGTAYLFTEEIVQAGAIVSEFQRQAINCDKTALLHSGLGYSTRCAQTAFCDDFDRVRDDLMVAGKSPDFVREKLEEFNLGRLRIASKGIVRGNTREASYVQVDTRTQIQEGMFMMGDVATLRNSTMSIAELHADVSLGSRAVLDKVALPEEPLPVWKQEDDDIAIVGMACMFPKAQNVREFWKNIVNGVDALEDVNPMRWDPDIYFDSNRFAPDKVYSKRGGFLGDIPFDPIEYGLPPVSLYSIEPTQLLALELSKLALRDAGYDRLPFPRERTSVFFGTGGVHDLGGHYSFRTKLPNELAKVEGLSPEAKDQIISSLYQQLPKWSEDSFPGILANVVSGRVANRLNLYGTNFTVEAACASSLSALDVGMDNLRLGKCDVALVGTIDCTNNAFAYMCFSKTHALSPRAVCLPFQDGADGLVISEGVAVLIIRRLRDAERDGDRIYALVKGMGSSSDGRNRSLTAPHPEGQVYALKRAYENAQVDPATVELIEAHGTGTAVGDKSEIESLNLAFEGKGIKNQRCAVGSVKSNIGHTKMAAGLAGLIKSTLALKHRIFPPTIGVETPNPHVTWSSTPFYINSETRPWFDKGKTTPRRSGVSAFGFGGTNFHAVLEEYQGNYRKKDYLDLNPRDVEIFFFGDINRTQVIHKISQLRQGLTHLEWLHLPSLGYAVYAHERKIQKSTGPPFCRLSIVAHSMDDFKHKLEKAEQGLKEKGIPAGTSGVYYQEGPCSEENVCFLFPGQGSQKINMLRDLLVAFPDLQDVVQRSDVLLAKEFPQTLSQYIYPLPVFSEAERQTQQKALDHTHVAQPALATVELAALEILKGFSIRPNFVAGHSFGEFVALCAADYISRDDLIRFAQIRGQVSSAVSNHGIGTMAAVQCDENTTLKFLKEINSQAFISNLNAPTQTIIGGKVDAIQHTIEAFKKKGIFAREIPVSAPFHTPLMKEAKECLTLALQEIQFRQPSCQVYSNTLGGRHPSSVEEIKQILGRHICEPVRFIEEIQSLHKAGARVFIEVGPGRVLTNLVGQILPQGSFAPLSLETKDRFGTAGIGHLLSEAWVRGVPVDFSRWYEGRGLSNGKIEDLFEQARNRANPPSTVWRVNGGKACPWNGPSNTVGPHQAERRAQVARAAPGNSEPNHLDPVTGFNSTFGERKTPMKKDDNQRDERQKHGNDSVISTHLLSQIQMSINQFIELQRSNQLIMQRYLDIQQQVLNAAVEGKIDTLVSPTPHVASAGIHSDFPTSFQSRPNAIPPAPVLPELKVTTKDDSLEKSFDSLSKEMPTETWVREKGGQVSPGIGGPGGDFLPTADQFKVALLQTVSERTGYPQDMLDLNANLEADLGIDSIKLVEILMTLEDYRQLLEEQEGTTAVIEELTNLKTLGNMVEWYEKARAKKLSGESTASETSDSLSEKKSPEQLRYPLKITPESPHSDMSWK